MHQDNKKCMENRVENMHADIRVLKVHNKTLGLASKEKVTIESVHGGHVGEINNKNIFA